MMTGRSRIVPYAILRRGFETALKNGTPTTSTRRTPTARFLSSSTTNRPPSSTPSSSSSTSGDPPPITANVVQGPSLMQTSVARSSPSLMFLPGLRSLPFWTSYDAASDTNRIAYQDPTLTHVLQHLEANVSTIRDEYHRVAPTLDSDYQHDTTNEHTTLHEGTWDWHSYMTKGKLEGHFGQYFPETTRILQQLRQSSDRGLPTMCLLEDIPFGYAFFSTLHPKSSIQAHVSPMNFRWRIHLPLEVPDRAAEPHPTLPQRPQCGIRVGTHVQTWTNGRALVLDDSYDHEVWNHTEQKRVVLLLDLWHPDISIQERKDIVGMFRYAKEQGFYDSPSKQAAAAKARGNNPASLNVT